MSCVSNLTIWLSYFENRVNNLDFPKPPGRIDTKHFRCNAILLECVQSLPSHWFSWRYNKMLTFVEVKFPALRHCFQWHFSAVFNGRHCAVKRLSDSTAYLINLVEEVCVKWSITWWNEIRLPDETSNSNLLIYSPQPLKLTLTVAISKTKK